MFKKQKEKQKELQKQSQNQYQKLKNQKRNNIDCINSNNSFLNEFYF